MNTEVLFIVNSISNGGIERVIYNIIKHLCSSIKFHVFVILSNDDHYYHLLYECGCEVVNISKELKKHSRFKHRYIVFSQIYNYLKQNPQISVIHVHSNNYSVESLLAAYIHQIPIRCVHAHSSYTKHWNPKLFSFKTRISLPIFRLFTNLLSTHKIGCSRAACISNFGHKADSKVIFNGVDLETFNPSNYESKEDLQKKYNLPYNAINFLFVGRYDTMKNCIFMIKVFKKVLGKYRNIHLSLVGHGILERSVKETVQSLNIEKFVSFYPHYTCIPEIMKASDYFISPSLSEGLGIVFVEAQLMRLTTFASNNVPIEADLGLCHFISLDMGESGYANYIIDFITSDERINSLNNRKVKSYDMSEIAKQYKNIYTES